MDFLYLFYLLFVAMVVFLPCFFYRLNKRWLAMLCLRMAISNTWRLFYGRVLLIITICAHLVFHNAFPYAMCVAVSSIVVICMFRDKWVHAFMRLNRDNIRLMFLFFIITLVVTVLLREMSIALTMGILITGVAYYPSSAIMDKSPLYLRNNFSCHDGTRNYSYIIGLYFNDVCDEPESSSRQDSGSNNDPDGLMLSL